ncbi:MAG: fructosamine kinase [Fluviicola sp.]|nr:MAG: fructosamine kinase [Fluviicola sp.]
MLQDAQRTFIENQINQKIINATSLSGGDINDVFKVETDEETLVIKINDLKRFPEMLEKEFRALDFLKSVSKAIYPSPIAHFSDDESQYLVMEYIAEGSNSSNGQKLLGQHLADQHRCSNKSFGWEENNYIGSLPQINTNKSNWYDFYAENRILYQIKIAFDSGIINKEVLNKVERFCAKIEGLFPKESPALLHGDLWGGNYFIDQNDQPLFYDPAVYYGHREIDIAMTRLFGGFSTEFYESYNESFPLEKGWENRIQYGQLYPNLVHLNLFGVGYLSSVVDVVGRF